MPNKVLDRGKGQKLVGMPRRNDHATMPFFTVLIQVVYEQPTLLERCVARNSGNMEYKISLPIEPTDSLQKQWDRLTPKVWAWRGSQCSRKQYSGRV